MPSIDVRLRNVVSGQSSAPVHLDFTVGAGNPDYGRDLRTWIQQPGGQELVLPDGVYSSGSITSGANGGAHGQFLILRAATPRGVVVDATSAWTGVTRVMFVGIEFRQRIQINPGCDRLATWHCRHRHPYGPPGNLQGVLINGGTNLHILGADVYDCTKDGIHMSAVASSTLRVEGTRFWNINDPSDVNHDDSFQIRGGTAVFDRCVFGVDEDGATNGNGHIQVQSDVDDADVTITRSDMSGSGNYGLTVDGKNSGRLCIVRRTDVHSWDHNNGDLNVLGGGQHIGSNVVLAEPSGPLSDADWLAEHPYGSYALWLAGSGL